MECDIRPWRLEDVPQLAVAMNNKNVQNNLRDGIPFPYTQEDAKEYIRLMQDAPADSQYAFAIVAGGKVVGSIAVFRGQNIHARTAEMGYYVAEPFWGKGIGTCAIQRICDYVFGNTDILRIFAEPFATNAASCRILEKAGFVCEGTLRSNAVKNGIVLDMKLYSRIVPNKESVWCSK